MSKTSKVLDLGCGDGEFIKLLSDRGFTEVDGLDISDVAIDRAKEKCCGELMIQDFSKPCLLPKKYDCIYDTDCFHMVVHKADRQTFLHNVRASLEPGGIFLTGINASKKGIDPMVIVEDHAQYYWPAEEAFIREVTDSGFVLISHRSHDPRNQTRCDKWMEIIFK